MDEMSLDKITWKQSEPETVADSEWTSVAEAYRRNRFITVSINLAGFDLRDVTCNRRKIYEFSNMHIT